MAILESESRVATVQNFESIHLAELPKKPHDITLRLQNIQDLYAIQTVIEEEENKNLSIDEVLARVLSLYSVYVQFPRVTLSNKNRVPVVSTLDLII